MKEIIDDRAQDRRNILAMTSQSPGPGTARKGIYMIRKVVAGRKERESIESASPRRVRDKTAGLGTNVQDIVLAVNRKINNGFNFDENWVASGRSYQCGLIFASGAFGMGYDLRRQHARVHCANPRRPEAFLLIVRWFVHLLHDDASLPKPPCTTR